MRLISSHLDQPSLVTSFFRCTGSKWAITREQDNPIWPLWVANQNTGLASYCPRGAFSNMLINILSYFPFIAYPACLIFAFDTFFANCIVTIINCGILHFVLAETRLTC